jgi:hypothetical protein
MSEMSEFASRLVTSDVNDEGTRTADVLDVIRPDGSIRSTSRACGIFAIAS